MSLHWLKKGKQRATVWSFPQHSETSICTKISSVSSEGIIALNYSLCGKLSIRPLWCWSLLPVYFRYEKNHLQYRWMNEMRKVLCAGDTLYAILGHIRLYDVLLFTA